MSELDWIQRNIFKLDGIVHWWRPGSTYCECGHGVAINEHNGKIRLSLMDLYQGFKYRIPFCCIVVFIFGPKPGGVKRGARYNSRGVYVPCGVFHKAQKDLHG